MTETADWQPINTAPYQNVILVRNPSMDNPVRATRGYADESGTVHPDTSFCTSVYTSDGESSFGFPGGKLVCPTEWKELEGAS